jgi:hypothetical protein
MERRNFLRGIVLGAGAVASTALVKVASDADVLALTHSRDVVLGPPPRTSAAPEAYPQLDILNGPIYIERDGQFVPIGFATQITVQAAVDEIIEWNGTVKLVPGLLRGTMEFKGPWR